MFTRLFGRKPQETLKLSVQFVVEPDDDRFHAYSPILPGLHADGATETEAAKNFVAEIPAYIQSLAKHGDPLPIGEIRIVHEPDPVRIPAGAFLGHVQKVMVQWPSLETSGIS